MSEALLLAITIFTLPLLGSHPLIALIVLLIVLPGTYAGFYGAPFVPTPKKKVQKMLALAEVKPGSIVYDIGCGDGRLVFAAADAGARATGYELSILMFLWSWIRSLFHPRSKIRLRDAWAQDYRKADVVFCYLLVSTMETFKQKVWPQLKPGCKVISHQFRMKEMKAAVDKDGVVMYVKRTNLPTPM